MERGPPKYLQGDEKVLMREGRHPLSILDELLGLVILMLLVAGGLVATFTLKVPSRVVPLFVTALITMAVGIVLLGFIAWWRVVTSDYVLTEQRVYASHGLLRFFLAQTTYDKVTDVHVRQSLFGRWGGFGTVRAETAGEGLHLVGVRDPFRVAKELETARVGFIRSLIERHVAARRPTKAAVAAFPGSPPRSSVALPPLWAGRPAWASFWLQVAPLAVMVVVFAIGGVAFALAQPQVGLLFLGGAVLFFGLIFAGLLIRQTTTRYEVHPWGVVVASGWLGRRRVETLFEKITDVTTTQGLVARLLDYGSLAINTAGGSTAPIVFAGVSRPDEVKAVIDGARMKRRAP